MREIKTSCDFCKKDLSCTNANHHTYGVQLENLFIPPKDESVTFAVMIHKPIENGPLCFCGFRCLKEWLKCEK